MKRTFPDPPLGKPLKGFDETFSAETVLLESFFRVREQCAHCRGHGRVGVMGCWHCGGTGTAQV